MYIPIRQVGVVCRCCVRGIHAAPHPVSLATSRHRCLRYHLTVLPSTSHANASGIRCTLHKASPPIPISPFPGAPLVAGSSLSSFDTVAPLDTPGHGALSTASPRPRCFTFAVPSPTRLGQLPHFSAPNLIAPPRPRFVGRGWRCPGHRRRLRG